MTNAWEVLKTMTPADYLEFRSAFRQASGFQSHQYRLIEFLLGNRNPFTMRPHEHRPDHHALLTETLHRPSIYDLAVRLLASRGLSIPDEVLKRDVAEVYEPNGVVLEAWLEVYRDTTRGSEQNCKSEICRTGTRRDSVRRRRVPDQA